MSEIKEACRPIAELAIAMNIDQDANQTAVVVRCLASNGWDVDRIREVSRFALSSRDALKTISYAGAITPLFFMEAEHQKWEQDHPIIGKCFTPYCNRAARVREWGEAYCPECHENHTAKIATTRRTYQHSASEWAIVTETRRPK